MTERLKKVVQWIIDNKDNIDCGGIKCPIKFLAVLGDIADSAEKSEFLKAKSILDKLNDPNGDGNTSDGIPYILVFGNHDVWPYTDFEEATTTLGEEYFDEIFWDENATNTKLLKERTNNSFKRDEIHPQYKNFAFSYKGMNFIGLDFVSGEPFPGPLKGVGPDAVLRWEIEKKHLPQLEEFAGKPVIIFSHHPFYKDSICAFESNEINKIAEIIKDKNVLANFGGHIHGFDKYVFEKLPGFEKLLFFNANKEHPSINTTPVITTEALMVGSNQEKPKGLIRIVKINDNNTLTQEDYNNWENTIDGTEFIALNPSLDFEYSGEGIGWVFFKAHAFTKRNHTFTWDYGDGNFGSGEWQHYWYREAGEYNVTLIAKDNETGVEERITRKIKIKEEAIIPRIIKITEEMKGKVEFISVTLEKDLTEFGRTMRDWVLIKVKHSPSIPVGLINVHFEQATDNIDLTQMITDMDLETKKSILYMPQWPETIEKDKVLFIPIIPR